MVHDILGVLFGPRSRWEVSRGQIRSVQHRLFLLLCRLCFIFMVLRLRHREDDVLRIDHHSRPISLRVVPICSSGPHVSNLLLILLQLAHHVECGDLFLISIEVLVLFISALLLIYSGDLALPPLLFFDQNTGEGGHLAVMQVILMILT